MILTDIETFMTITVFALIMIGIVRIRRNKHIESLDSFYLADRKVGINSGALSISVSWIWAPALFVASSIAYDLGIAGAIWFIVPNIACFFIFAPLAIKFRELMPEGYTLPGYMKMRYPGNTNVALAFSATTVLFGLAAIVENLVAISKLFEFYTDLSGTVAIVVLSFISMGYSLRSGFKASVVTDVFQMLLVVLIGLILVPWSLGVTASEETLTAGFWMGADNSVSWMAIAFAPGLSLLFGLIGGPIGDQMFFQRTMAVEAKNIKKTLYRAGVYFAIVPITLSVFGFLGVSLGDAIHVNDSELVGAIIVSSYLPKTASLLFFFMMLCGLASTLDSAYCAGGTVFGRDIYSMKHSSDVKIELRNSRLFMVGMGLAGVFLAVFSRDIWYVFMTDAAIASSGIVPIILSVYWKKQTSQATFWSVLISIVFGCSTSIAGHFYDLQTLAALGAPIAVVVGLVVSISISLSSNQ